MACLPILPAGRQVQHPGLGAANVTENSKAEKTFNYFFNSILNVVPLPTSECFTNNLPL